MAWSGVPFKVAFRANRLTIDDAKSLHHQRRFRTRLQSESLILVRDVLPVDLAPRGKRPISFSAFPGIVRRYVVERDNLDVRRFDDAHGSVAIHGHDPAISRCRQAFLLGLVRSKHGAGRGLGSAQHERSDLASILRGEAERKRLDIAAGPILAGWNGVEVLIPVPLDLGGHVQSARSAVIGSTAVARRAGTNAATTATATSSTADTTIVAGSAGSTPNSRPFRNRDSGIAAAPPTARPMSAMAAPSPRIIRRISTRWAPSATRMPSSFVRWLTEKASTPATPTVAMTSASAANSPMSVAFSRCGAIVSSRISSSVCT